MSFVKSLTLRSCCLGSIVVIYLSSTFTLTHEPLIRKTPCETPLFLVRCHPLLVHYSAISQKRCVKDELMPKKRRKKPPNPPCPPNALIAHPIPRTHVIAPYACLKNASRDPSSRTPYANSVPHCFLPLCAIFGFAVLFWCCLVAPSHFNRQYNPSIIFINFPIQQAPFHSQPASVSSAEPPVAKPLVAQLSTSHFPC